MTFLAIWLLCCTFVALAVCCVLMRDMKKDMAEMEEDHKRVVEELECEVDKLTKVVQPPGRLSILESPVRKAGSSTNRRFWPKLLPSKEVVEEQLEKLYEHLGKTK